MLQLSSLSDTPVYDIYIAARTSALLTVALKMGLFERLNASTDISVQEASQQFDITERGAEAMLVGLYSMKLLQKQEERYSMTEHARQYLVKSAPCYLGALIELEWDDFITPKSLLQAMKTNIPQAYGGDQGKDVWQTHEEDAEKTRHFTRAMHSISIRPALALAQTLSSVFQSHKCLLDVGGGSGVYPIAILTKHRHLHSIVFEIPSVCPVTKEFLSRYHVDDRCITHPGDMFNDAYPTHFSCSSSSCSSCSSSSSSSSSSSIAALEEEKVEVDMIFYSQILHDWPREKGKMLLQKAYDSLPNGGVVLINEKLLQDDKSGPTAVAMVSIDMLFWTEGQQYSAKELFGMLESVGFKRPQVLPTIGYWSVVWAYKE